MTGRSVKIRPFQTSDAQEIWGAVQESLDELPQWMPDLNADLSVEAIHRWIEEQAKQKSEGSAYHFAIIDSQNGYFLGSCGLTQMFSLIPSDIHQKRFVTKSNSQED